MYKRGIEISVGIFMILGLLALIFLALKVSGLSIGGKFWSRSSYQLIADFSDVGGLKVRSPVRVAGVQIGVVNGITLNPTTYKADVSLKITQSKAKLPDDSSASIVASGLLGDNYISLQPGYSSKFYTNGNRIETTYSATNLQSLISTFMSGSHKK